MELTNVGPAQPPDPVRLPDGIRVLVVAHDAGGAEILSAWVRRHPHAACRFLLDGPAVGVFRRAQSVDPYRPSALDRLLTDVDLVLCGSSWASGLERRAVRAARAAAVKSVVFLDHWVNYAERFNEAGCQVLPDEIWVGDPHAAALAARVFPAQEIRYEENPHFQDVLEAIRRFDGDRRRGHVLYVAEPVQAVQARLHGDPNRLGWDEFSALDGFLRFAAGIPDTQVRLRHHPSEARGKYDDLLTRHSLVVQTSPESQTLAEDIGWADWVVGLESMAMVIALLAGRRVSSALPSGAPAIRLPFPQIERLFP